MASKTLPKLKRQECLVRVLEKDPFYTDLQLAEKFGVSVQTIRLDRLTLGIPEVRKRIRLMAAQAYDRVRSLAGSEVVGNLVELELGVRGISILKIEPEMVLARTGVARGHYLFAQANSLAVALIDAEVVLTGSARVRYKRPVYSGEEVVAKGTVRIRKGENYLVSVQSLVNTDLVFKGQYIVSAQEKRLSGEEKHA